MNRWDEGSWDSDPHRHGRFTIIANRGIIAFIKADNRMLYKLYLKMAIQYMIR